MSLIRATVRGELSEYLEEERRRVARGLRIGVEAAALEVRGDLRSQVRSGGFRASRGLEAAWKSRTYPNNPGQSSLKPSALVYSRAERIHRGHDEAPIITTRQGTFLAFPTPFNAIGGRRNASRRGGVRVTTAEMVRQRGFLVPFKNGRGYLWCLRPRVASTRSRRGRGRRLIFVGGGVQVFTGNTKGRAKRIADALERRIVPMFFLVRVVRLRPRTRIDDIRGRAPAILARNLAAGLQRTRNP